MIIHHNPGSTIAGGFPIPTKLFHAKPPVDSRLGKTAALTVFLGSFLCLQRAERKNVELMQLCCNVGAGLLWLGALGSLGQSWAELGVSLVSFGKLGCMCNIHISYYIYIYIY